MIRGFHCRKPPVISAFLRLWFLWYVVARVGIKRRATFADVLEMAKGAKGADEEGYRIELINKVR